MNIQLCDRCGLQTDNSAAFLIPTIEEKGPYRVNNTWFGDPITLCDDCLKEFDNFRLNHKRYEIHFKER